MNNPLQPNNAQNDQDQVQTIIPREILVGLNFGNDRDFINFLVPSLENNREELQDRTLLLIPLLRRIPTADALMPYQSVEEVREFYRVTEIIEFMTHFRFLPGESMGFKRDMFIDHMIEFRFELHPFYGYLMADIENESEDENENPENVNPRENQNRARNNVLNFENHNDSDDERAENENLQEGEQERLRNEFNEWYHRLVYSSDSDNEEAQTEDEGEHDN